MDVSDRTRAGPGYELKSEPTPRVDLELYYRSTAALRAPGGRRGDPTIRQGARLPARGANISHARPSPRTREVNFCSSPRYAMPSWLERVEAGRLTAVNCPCAVGGYAAGLSPDWIVMADDGTPPLPCQRCRCSPSCRAPAAFPVLLDKSKSRPRRSRRLRLHHEEASRALGRCSGASVDEVVRARGWAETP